MFFIPRLAKTNRAPSDLPFTHEKDQSNQTFLRFVGKTNADVKISLLSLFGSRAEKDGQ
jgi:hypothetical protein